MDHGLLSFRSLLELYEWYNCDLLFVEHLRKFRQNDSQLTRLWSFRKNSSKMTFSPFAFSGNLHISLKVTYSVRRGNVSPLFRVSFTSLSKYPEFLGNSSVMRRGTEWAETCLSSIGVVGHESRYWCSMASRQSFHESLYLRIFHSSRWPIISWYLTPHFRNNRIMTLSVCHPTIRLDTHGPYHSTGRITDITIRTMKLASHGLIQVCS